MKSTLERELSVRETIGSELLEIRFGLRQVGVQNVLQWSCDVEYCGSLTRCQALTIDAQL